MSLNDNFSDCWAGTDTNTLFLGKQGKAYNTSVYVSSAPCVTPFSVVDVVRLAMLLIKDEGLIYELIWWWSSCI